MTVNNEGNIYKINKKTWLNLLKFKYKRTRSIGNTIKFSTIP